MFQALHSSKSAAAQCHVHRQGAAVSYRAVGAMIQNFGSLSCAVHHLDMSSACVSTLSCSGSSAAAGLRLHPFNAVALCSPRRICITPFRSSRVDQPRFVSVSAASVGSNMLQGLKRAFTKVRVWQAWSRSTVCSVSNSAVPDPGGGCRSRKSRFSKAAP